MTLSTAREKLRAAHALRGLPAISAAFADGRALVFEGPRAAHAPRMRRTKIYCSRTRSTRLRSRSKSAAGRCADVAPPESDGRRAPRVRAALADRESQSGMRHALDSRRATGRGRRSRRERARRRRRGRARFSGRHRVRNGSRRLPPEAASAEQADAFVAIIKTYLAGGRSGDHAGSVEDHHQVVLHVEARALSGGAGRSDLPLETIKRLTSGSGTLIHRVVEDERSTPLDVGRKQRVVPTAIRARAVVARSRLHVPWVRGRQMRARPSHPT